MIDYDAIILFTFDIFAVIILVLVVVIKGTRTKEENNLTKAVSAQKSIYIFQVKETGEYIKAKSDKCIGAVVSKSKLDRRTDYNPIESQDYYSLYIYYSDDCRKEIEYLKNNGIKDLHWRISSFPFKYCKIYLSRNLYAWIKV